MDTQTLNTTDTLVDKFGRRVDYVRLSVTDRCDFRCVYCMTEDMTFLPRKQILSLEELYRVARCFTELGVKKIRLTGGEPMVRSNVMELIQRLGQLPGLEELLLTTNGAQLPKYAAALRQAGVNRINISIDSLDAERFKRISRVGKLESVVAGIEAACAVGFDRIRLNSVIMHGYNDDEIIPLTDFAVARGVDIAFIEEMPLGEASDHKREETTCSNAWVRQMLEQKYSLVDTTTRTAGPSRYTQIAGEKTRVGFISPVTHNFCADCNRVRVTVEGRLLLCLGNEHSMDLRAILRDTSATDEDLKQALIASMDIKPERHYFYEKDHAQPVRLMNMTGG
ncbi:MAG: GTP 3',8-cyclase MoaA [Pseudohongiellaceae bacterium]